MSINIGVSSAWKNVSALYVGVSSAWKSVAAVWVAASGAWKLAWAALNAQPADATDSEISPTDALASVIFTNTGTCTNTGNPGFTWLVTGSASDYDIYVSGTGDTPTGAALDTWHNLGTNREWRLEVTGVGTLSFTGTYQIRAAGGGSTLASNTISIFANVDV